MDFKELIKEKEKVIKEKEDERLKLETLKKIFFNYFDNINLITEFKIKYLESIKNIKVLLPEDDFVILNFVIPLNLQDEFNKDSLFSDIFLKNIIKEYLEKNIKNMKVKFIVIFDKENKYDVGITVTEPEPDRSFCIIT